jgi:4-amino-4-deoxy-L-arabinose transferase-like glycosyltransferase
VRGRARTLASVLAVLLMGAAALALAHAAGLPAGLAWSDEIAYAVAARHIVDGDGPVSSFAHPDSILAGGLPQRDVHMPGHQYLLAAGFLVLGPSEWAARAVGQAAFLLAGVLVFLTGRLLQGRAAGLWAAALFCFFPGVAGYGASAMSEATLLPLVAGWWLLWLVASRDGRPIAAAAMGLLLAVTATHHETALALLLPALFVLWRWPLGSRRRAAFLFAAGFLPWMALVFWPMYRARAPYPHFLSYMSDTVKETGSLRPVLENLSRNLQPWSRLDVGFAVYALIVACAAAAVALAWRRPGLVRRLATWNAVVFASTFVVLAPVHVLRGWSPVRMFLVMLPPALAVLGACLPSRATLLQGHALPALALLAFVGVSIPANAWLARDRRDEDQPGRAHSAFIRSQTAGVAPRVVIAARGYRYGWDAYPTTVVVVDVDGLLLRALARRVAIDAVVTARATPFFLDELRRQGFERVSDTADEGRYMYGRRGRLGD